MQWSIVISITTRVRHNSVWLEKWFMMAAKASCNVLYVWDWLHVTVLIHMSVHVEVPYNNECSMPSVISDPRMHPRKMALQLCCYPAAMASCCVPASVSAGHQEVEPDRANPTQISCCNGKSVAASTSIIHKPTGATIIGYQPGPEPNWTPKLTGPPTIRPEFLASKGISPGPGTRSWPARSWPWNPWRKIVSLTDPWPSIGLSMTMKFWLFIGEFLLLVWPLGWISNHP